LLGNLSAKVGREDIFKLTVGNECIHGIINDNEVTVVNCHIKSNCQEFIVPILQCS